MFYCIIHVSVYVGLQNKGRLEMASVIRPDEDWQSRQSIIECNRRMWIDQLACDVTFIVGQAGTRIGAHKYVLGSRSCVFYAMFFGPLSNNTGTEVTVPDMMQEQFNGLLQFLYTEDVKVDVDNVLPMLYAAKKYCVQSLIDKCLNTLKRNMVPENVCTVMENAHFYGNNELKSKCLNLILQETERVFNADDLVELCNECLISIIRDDSIGISEEKVFEAVMKFGKAKCERKNLEASQENLKRELADVIPYVRFPLMNSDFVMEDVDKSGLLSVVQLKTLFQYFLKDRSGECPGFISRKRKAVYVLQRFGEVVSGWGYKRDKCDAVSFKCSRDIEVKGFQIYGSCQGPGELEINLRLLQEPYRGNVAIKRVLVETDGKQKVYSVYFDNPATLRAERLYTVSLVVKGPTTYYGVKGEENVAKEGVMFTFSKTPLSTNNTTSERGQIPGIMFELMPQNDENQAMET